MRSAQPFDRATGELRADGLSLVIGPALTRDDFEAHPDAARFERFASPAQDPYRGYHAALHLGGEPFRVVLWFTGQRLERLTISSRDPQYDTGLGSTPEEQRPHLDFLNAYAQDGTTSISVGYR